MLRSLFIIFFFQLLGEAIQKFFEINIPGPVIGLVLLLLVFIFFLKSSSQFKKIKRDISNTSHQIINYLSLLFVPIGVGVVMHINYLGDNLFKILAIVYLQAEPLFWITLTLGAFLVGDYLYKKSKLNPLVNPVAISILIVSTVLLTLDVSYDRYFNGAKFIHFMLGPATVALAIPIYEKKDLIFKEIITYYLASFFNLDKEIILTMIPRNVTAPIAMGIAELIGGIPSLTAIITIITGNRNSKSNE